MLTKKIMTNKGNYLDGVFLIAPKVFEDERGFFYESWNKKDFEKIINTNFLQDNHSKSIKGVLRGLHYQLNPYSQGKLVRCTSGKVFDVAVDLRTNSKTYKEWVGLELCSSTNNSIFIPEGCAHGFQTMEDDCELLYIHSKNYEPNSERGIRWDDPIINIDWPLKINQISERDSKLPYFLEI